VAPVHRSDLLRPDGVQIRKGYKHGNSDTELNLRKVIDIQQTKCEKREKRGNSVFVCMSICFAF
jgi:hypothetical protein